MITFGPEWERFNQRLGNVPRLQEADLRRVLTASLTLIERDARNNAPRDTGRLGGTINHRIDGVFPRLVGQVGPSVRYGAPVEFGRRAGAKMPPVDALLGWVRRHWSPRGFTMPSGTRFPGRVRNRAWRGRDAELRSKAFTLARSIKKKADTGDRSLTAHPYMTPAWNSNRVRIQQAFARIGVRTVAYLAGNPLP